MKFTELYTRPAEFFNNLETNEFRVKAVRSPADLERALRVRMEGYKMYFGSNHTPADDEEVKPNETTYLAVDKLDNPIGTIRVLDRSKGEIELDHFLDVDTLLKTEENPCAEATRFAISKHPRAIVVKLLLWRAYLDYCRLNQIRTALISSRKILARNYEFLLFKDIGEKGVYKHNQLKNKEHHTYKMDIPDMPNLWRRAKHPLYKFMFVLNL